MELPINEKELSTIINAMRLGGDSALYYKLWNYKMNYLRKEKETKIGPTKKDIAFTIDAGPDLKTAD